MCCSFDGLLLLLVDIRFIVYNHVMDLCADTVFTVGVPQCFFQVALFLYGHSVCVVTLFVYVSHIFVWSQRLCVVTLCVCVTYFCMVKVCVCGHTVCVCVALFLYGHCVCMWSQCVCVAYFCMVTYFLHVSQSSCSLCVHGVCVSI